MTCKTLMSDGVSCYENANTFNGYNSLFECQQSGALYADNGFECGRGCRISDYDITVCKEVCNANGCSD